MILGGSRQSVIHKRVIRRRLVRAARPLLFFAFFAAAIAGLYYWGPLAQTGTGGKTNSVLDPGTADTAQVSSQISSLLGLGDYSAAKSLLQDVLRKNPADPVARRLSSLLTEDLDVDFRFNYLPGRTRKITVRGTGAPMALSRNDPYYLVVHPVTKCFLYVFQHRSSGDLVRLFPNGKWVPTRNPVPGGPIRIPDGVDWFYLDDVPGTEVIYLIACRWRQRHLEELTSRLDGEQDEMSRTPLIRQILEQLESKERRQTPCLGWSSPGMSFAMSDRERTAVL